MFLCIESPRGPLGCTAEAGWSESDLIWILLQTLYLVYFRDNGRLESIIVLGGELMGCRETLGTRESGADEGWSASGRGRPSAACCEAPRVACLPHWCCSRDSERCGGSAYFNQLLLPPNSLPFLPRTPQPVCLSVHPGSARTQAPESSSPFPTRVEDTGLT